MKLKFAAMIAVVLLVCVSCVAEEIELIKVIRVPGNQIDLSGLEKPLSDSISHNLFGGISALEYTGKDDLYIALPDRGPKDGAVDWNCRFHVVKISLEPGNTEPEFSIKQTVIMRDGEKTFSGLATRFKADAEKTSRFDPEGVRIAANGNLYVADEYGPHIIEFNRSGQKVAQLKSPGRYKVAHPKATKAEENAANHSGRQGNRGVEGLAIQKDKNQLFGLFQSPLLQDCERLENGKPTGLNCRLFEYQADTELTREFVYPLDKPKNKLNEILRISDHQFLVIERDGKTGAESEFKKIIRIDVAACSDVKNMKRLPPNKLPSGIKPVEKTTFIDLLDPGFGLAGEQMPEKIEGLSFGPDLADGRKTLLVASDNDFAVEQPTIIYCFAMGMETTPGNDTRINN